LKNTLQQLSQIYNRIFVIESFKMPNFRNVELTDMIRVATRS
jgi:hypothetical protein